jgi:hypothetical protein
MQFGLELKKKFSHGLSRRKRADYVFGHSQCDPGELFFWQTAPFGSADVNQEILQPMAAELQGQAR